MFVVKNKSMMHGHFGSLITSHWPEFVKSVKWWGQKEKSSNMDFRITNKNERNKTHVTKSDKDEKTFNSTPWLMT